MKKRILTTSVAALFLVLCTSVFLVLSGRFDNPVADPQGKSVRPTGHSEGISIGPVANPGGFASAIPKSGRRYLPVIDNALRASWQKDFPADYPRIEIQWVLREIFSGMELPESAHSFGPQGFKIAPKDAMPFFERLVAAVTGPPDPNATLGFDDEDYTFDRGRFYSVEVQDSRDWFEGRRTRPKVNLGRLTIAVQTKPDPSIPENSYRRGRPSYYFSTNSASGEVFYISRDRTLDD